MAFPEKSDHWLTYGPGTMVNAEADRRWNVSERVAGELILKPQQCELSTIYCPIQLTGSTPRFPVGTTYIGLGLGSVRYWFRGNIIHGGSIHNAPWPALATRARARFLGKWEVPSASLGVTLASWRQAAAMLKSNGGRMLNAVETLEMKLRRVKLSRNRKLKKDLDKIRPGLVADLYLEFIFGWIPLFQDFKAISHILCTPDHKEQYLRGTASDTVRKQYSQVVEGNYGGTRGYNSASACRVTVAGAVRVENPNYWLLQQLGLLNLPGVAVDLIPWSFVTGMFWNQAAFVGQLTDTFGLDLRDVSSTYSLRGSSSAWALPKTGGQAYYKGGYKSNATHTQKYRTLGTLPNVSATLKDFKLDLGKTAILFSLAAQKLSKLPVSPWNPNLR